MILAIALLLGVALVGCNEPDVVSEERVEAVSVEEEADNLITIEKFNRLQKGMSLSDAEAILGQTADELITEDAGIQQYKWNNPRRKGWVVAVFRDDQLREMSSYSLPSE